MDVYEAIVKNLENIGVDHIFGGSGQVNGNMMLALKKSGKIKTVIIRNEQAASFMACGYAMYSDKLGVCVATGGPGEFNLFSGLAVALSDSLPVLAISGFVSEQIAGKGALNESTGKNRTPDSRLMFNATTKRSFIIKKPEQTCDVLEEAINIAFKGRPGPVHIHVPKDVATMQVDNYRDVDLKIDPVLPDLELITKASDAIVNHIQSGKKCAFLIGYGTIRSHAEKEVLALIERYQIPFMTTMDAKGVLPEDHPLSLGVYGTSGDPGANAYHESADLIIAMGNSFAQNATFNYKDVYSSKTLIHINIDENEIGKVYKPNIGIVSNIKPALATIAEQLVMTCAMAEPKTIEKDKYYDKVIGHNGDKIHPAELSQAISRNLPPDTFLMGDAGSGMLWLNCYTQLTQNQLFQNPGSFGPMASHVNGAIGVKCANPDKTVVCVPGDGAYTMGGFELMTCVQNNIPVVYVILNNGEFNVIKKFLINIFGEYAHIQFDNPDFVKYAEACGAKGFRAENIEDFEEAFKNAIALNEPVIIDAVVENDVYPPFGLGKV